MGGRTWLYTKYPCQIFADMPRSGGENLGLEWVVGLRRKEVCEQPPKCDDQQTGFQTQLSLVERLDDCILPRYAEVCFFGGNNPFRNKTPPSYQPSDTSCPSITPLRMWVALTFIAITFFTPAISFPRSVPAAGNEELASRLWKSLVANTPRIPSPSLMFGAAPPTVTSSHVSGHHQLAR